MAIKSYEFNSKIQVLTLAYVLLKMAYQGSQPVQHNPLPPPLIPPSNSSEAIPTVASLASELAIRTLETTLACHGDKLLAGLILAGTAYATVSIVAKTIEKVRQIYNSSSPGSQQTHIVINNHVGGATTTSTTHLTPYDIITRKPMVITTKDLISAA
jgi:hypothetical protein